LRNSKNYSELPYNPELKQRAKELRKAGVLAEVLLWEQLKNKQLNNLDFDRQKIIGNYIVDFYSPDINLVIEIDGNSHNDKYEYDKKRDEYLECLDLTIIHLKDKDVLQQLREVMDYLENHPACSAGTPPKEGNN